MRKVVGTAAETGRAVRLGTRRKALQQLMRYEERDLNAMVAYGDPDGRRKCAGP